MKRERNHHHGGSNHGGQHNSSFQHNSGSQNNNGGNNSHHHNSHHHSNHHHNNHDNHHSHNHNNHSSHHSNHHNSHHSSHYNSPNHNNHSSNSNSKYNNKKGNKRHQAGRNGGGNNDGRYNNGGQHNSSGRNGNNGHSNVTFNTISNNNNNGNNNDSYNSNGNGNDNGHTYNGDHCCFPREISQDPFLRQLNAKLSQFLTNNRKPWQPGSSSSSSPPPLDVVMADAVQASTDWQKMVNGIPNAAMLLGCREGRFIGQALHAYFYPWMAVDVQSETYMVKHQDMTDANSQGVSVYTVCSRNPILPNGPAELCVKLRKASSSVEMVVSASSAAGIDFAGLGGPMNQYSKDLGDPIEGYSVSMQLDLTLEGLYLSMIMAKVEKGWDYVYDHLVRCPQ